MSTIKGFSVILVLIVLAFGGVFLYQSKQSSSISGVEIEQIVENYLINNPEILVKVSETLELKKEEAITNQTKKLLHTRPELIFASNSPQMGNLEGEITLLKFLDYQCIHCKNMEPIVTELLENNASLKVIIKEYPIFGEDSEFAAKAAIAAGKQSKFKEMHEALSREKDPLDHTKVLSIAQQIGLNVKQLQIDIQSENITEELESVRELASELSIEGTPYFLLIGKPMKNQEETKLFILPGAVKKEDLQELINQL